MSNVIAFPASRIVRPAPAVQSAPSAGPRSLRMLVALRRFACVPAGERLRLVRTLEDESARNTTNSQAVMTIATQQATGWHIGKCAETLRAIGYITRARVRCSRELCSKPVTPERAARIGSLEYCSAVCCERDGERRRDAAANALIEVLGDDDEMTAG